MFGVKTLHWGVLESLSGLEMRERRGRRELGAHSTAQRCLWKAASSNYLISSRGLLLTLFISQMSVKCYDQ